MKKLIAGLALICLCVSLLTACAGDGSTENTGSPVEWNDSSSPTETSETTTPETGEPVVEEKNDPVIIAEYKISSVLTGFCENRAWVEYYTGGVKNCALIDENGYIIFSLSSSDGLSCFPTEFSNGRTWIGTNKDGLTMLDVDGNIMFDSRAQSEGTGYYFVRALDGINLLIEKVENFSTNARYCCEVDSEGNIISRTELFEETWGVVSYIGDYVGEGLFIRSDGVVYNSKTRNILDLSELYADTVVAVDQGYVFVKDNGKLRKIPVNAFDSEDSWEKFDFDSSYLGLWNDVAISEGFIHCEDRDSENTAGIYDYNGQLLVQYPENWNIQKIFAFQNGYAALTLKGADNDDYIAIVDASGNLQYDPVEFDIFTSNWNGYVLFSVGNKTIALTPAGEEITQEEYWLLQAEEKVGSSGKIWGYSVDAYGNTGRYFFGKDGDVLDTIYLLSEGGENGAGNGTSPEIEYQFPSSYSIDGKWKNVGTYTFGQVQAGAIVVFDGSHCNFYSPSDTYAFYEKQMAYKLDVTSLLGETLSFVVRIVDENNIHIYNGDNYLELTRVN